MGRYLGTTVLIALLVACGEPATRPQTEVRADEHAPRPAAPVALEVEAAAPPAPVDLLHAVGTEVAVSSVYRDQASQVDHLVDGDLETAWNSRTEDLVGAWIEVRVPAGAEVVALALTPGFTRVRGENDLFLGNHRVARVRVLCDGTELGAFPLDVASRTPVRLPVTGGGGVYRIEVVEVLPGTHANWRETCISELQVLGRAEGMAEGARIPRTGVGALPAPRTPAPVDAIALDAQLTRTLASISGIWSEQERELHSLAENTGEPFPDEYMQQEFERRRDAMLARVVTLADPVSPLAADAARLRALRAVDWHSHVGRRNVPMEDLDVIARSLDRVATLVSPAARCRTASALVGMRLRRLAGQARLDSYYDEVDYPIDRDQTHPERARSDAVARNETRIGPITSRWSREPLSVATLLLSRTDALPPASALEWGGLRSGLEIVRDTCAAPAVTP